MEPIDLLSAAPLALLIAVTMCMLIADLWGKMSVRGLWIVLAIGSALIAVNEQRNFVTTAFKGMVYVDAFTWVFSSIILCGAFVSLLFGGKLLSLQRAESGIDVDVLMLLAACGGMVMVAAANLVLLFVGFELLSISVYVLAGIARHERASSEAALKYFLLGAFSSAFLLYGMALVYGATGSLSMIEIARHARPDNLLLLVGIGLMIFGFGFKVSLVPFHVWTPDVYQGAPVSITTFMAVVVKAAAFGGFLRLMSVAFAPTSEMWTGLIWVLCVITMTVGNLVALRQKSIKRMLAYSSIAHAGYALIGFVVFGPHHGAEATIFYILAYSLMTVTAFGVVLFATAGTGAQYGNDDIDSLSGLGWTNPFLGILMTIAMLSLAGMPPFAGFMGKFYLFRAAVSGGYSGLAIIAALNSVVSLYYYLRVLVVMYFKTEESAVIHPSNDIPRAPRFALALAALLTVYFGIFAETAMNAVSIAVQSMGADVFPR